MMSEWEDPCEAENWNVGGVHYRAGRATANRVSSRVYATPEWLEYSTLDNLLQFAPQTSTGTLDDWRKIARDAALAWRSFHVVAAQIIREEVGD